MQYFVLVIGFILVPSLMALIDRRIKGYRSIFMKFVNMITVTAFVFLMIYFYGQSIVSIFRINIKSFSNMKDFFTGRMLVILTLLLFVLFIAFKLFFVSLAFRNIEKTYTSEEKIFKLLVVTFDLALIPNIFVNSNSFGVFVILTALEVGLVYVKLVFSNVYVVRREALA